MSLDLDVAVFDLEDGVAPNRKQAARDMLRDHLRAKHQTYPSSMERCIRMNHVGSGLEGVDLEQCVLPVLPFLDSVLVPKVEDPDQLHYVADAISEYIKQHHPEREHAVEIIAAIESAKGFMNLKEIGAASLAPYTRLTGLLYASEDLCADMGMTRTPSRVEMMYSRQKLVLAARAYKLDSIDLVCIDYLNEDILITEAQEGFQWGFTGKQAIHPNQIQPIYRAFCPPPEKVDFAREIVKGFEEYSKQGKGAFEVHGKMIDMPMLKWAQGILRLIDTPSTPTDSK